MGAITTAQAALLMKFDSSDVAPMRIVGSPNVAAAARTSSPRWSSHVPTPRAMKAAAKVAAANQAKIDAQLKIDEEGLIQQKILESQDDELRRSRLIAQALLVGRITDYVDDPQYGGFITFDVLMPDKVTCFALHRNARVVTDFLAQSCQ